MSRDYQSPDWRGLCEELVEFVARLTKHYYEPAELLVRARAALAADHEAVGPTDEELLELWTGWNLGWDPRKGTVLMPHPAEYARAVLARWGSGQVILDSSAAPVPAEGEVADYADFVAWLASEMPAGTVISDPLWWAPRIARRAADLLERQAAPVPVAVSERLPEPEDCDAEGRCWVHQPHEACPESPAWELMSAKYAGPNYEAVCWLPFNALPLPGGEVEA